MAQVDFSGVAPLAQLHRPTPYRPEMNGFDDDATPTWQMVPVGDSRFVQIKVLGAKAPTVTSDQPSFASVAPEAGAGARKDVYCITGKQEGKAAVIVSDGGKEISRMDVRVLAKRCLSVQFFLVSDNAKHAAKTKESDIKDWVDTANTKIYGPQMNLTFSLRGVKPVTIAEDLHDPIDFGNIGDMPAVPRTTPAEKRWHLITDKGDTKTTIFNVFMLWDYKANSPDTSAFVESKTPVTADQMAKSGANFNMCMMKDVAPDDMANIPYLIFAHECGHYLEGMPFHHPASAPSLLLMREDGQIGDRLVKRDVEAWFKRWPAREKCD